MIKNQLKQILFRLSSPTDSDIISPRFLPIRWCSTKKQITVLLSTSGRSMPFGIIKTCSWLQIKSLSSPAAGCKMFKIGGDESGQSWWKVDGAKRNKMDDLRSGRFKNESGRSTKNETGRSSKVSLQRMLGSDSKCVGGQKGVNVDGPQTCLGDLRRMLILTRVRVTSKLGLV